MSEEVNKINTEPENIDLKNENQSDTASQAGAENNEGTTTSAAPGMVQPMRLIPEAKRRDAIFMIIFLIFSCIGVYSTLFNGANLGYLISAGFIAIMAAIYVSISGSKPSVFSIFCYGVSFLAAVPFVLYRDFFSRFLLIIASIVFLVSGMLISTGSNRHPVGSGGFFSDIMYGCVAVSLTGIPTMASSIHNYNSSKNEKNKTFSSVIIGLLCAVPVLLLLIPLLMSSDAAFEALIDRINLPSFPELFVSALLGTLLFFPLFSCCFMFAKKSTARKEASTIAAKRPVSAAAAGTFLGAISAVYLIYLFSQLAYFISGFLGILPESYTAAQYARRGFFEMVVICVINLIIVMSALSLSRREDDKSPLVVRIFALFICIMSLFFAACSVAKMLMYIDRFGMTRLRILTTTFLLVIVCVFISMIFKVFISKFPYFKVVLVSVAVLGLSVAFADIDTTVARYNTNAYLSGKLKTVDVETIDELSQAGIPYLYELYCKADSSVSNQAKHCLENKLYDYYDITYGKDGRIKKVVELEKDDNILSYNLTSYRAKKAMDSFAEEYR